MDLNDWLTILGFAITLGIGYVNHMIAFTKLQSKLDSEIKLVKQDYNSKIKEVKNTTETITATMNKIEIVLERFNETQNKFNDTQTELKIAIATLTSEIKSLNKHNKNDDNN